MWQVRGVEIWILWFWPCDLTSCMWQVRGPWFGFLVTLWDNFGSIGVCLGFVECQFQGFWLNLVHEVGWFGFLEAHEAWKFFVWSNQLKRGMEPYLYALGKRNFD